MPLYTLRHVTRHRAHGGARFRLNIPALDIRPGEFAAIVGPSGCGKSTLLDLLGLVLRPHQADTFDFHPPGAPPVPLGPDSRDRDLTTLRRAHIGYVLQTGGLLPFLTIEENILLPLRLNHRPLDRGRLHALAQRLGIADQLKKRPARLSGGQRQRAAIARAIIHQPSVILADEPTAAVDEFAAAAIIELFRELIHDTGVTLLMVTHNRPLVEKTADRLLTFRLAQAPDGTVESTLHPAP